MAFSMKVVPVSAGASPIPRSAGLKTRRGSPATSSFISASFPGFWLASSRSVSATRGSYSGVARANTRLLYCGGMSATDRSGPASSGPALVSGDEARAFFQQRLALMGKAYAVIALSSHLMANLVSSFRAGYRWSQLVTDLISRLVLGASATYILQWLVCRQGRLSEAALIVMDGISTTVVAVCSAFLVFATFPGEVPGISYARALLLVSFGLVTRAVVVPSTARRTLLLGLLATCFP